jgi:hypothetical protein
MLVYINERKVQEEFPGVTVDRYVVYVNNYKDSCKDDSGAIRYSLSITFSRILPK